MTTRPSRLAISDPIECARALQERALAALAVGRNARAERLLRKAASLVEEGCDALRVQGLLTGELESLADFIVSRSH